MIIICYYYTNNAFMIQIRNYGLFIVIKKNQGKKYTFPISLAPNGIKCTQSTH